MTNKKKATRIVYRIAKGFPGAGQFVKKSTWKRSKSAGGKRYIRASFSRKPRRRGVVRRPAKRLARVPRTPKRPRKRPAKRRRPRKRKQPVQEPIEYVIDQELKSATGKKRSPGGKLMIHLFAPKGLDREQTLDGIENWTLGQPLPDQWTIRAIDWRTKEYSAGQLQGMLRAMYQTGKL